MSAKGGSSKRGASKQHRYTNEQRAAALEVYRTDGPRDAAKQTGIPARTISRWAAAAGVSTDVTQKTTSATEAARAKAAELRTRLEVALLERSLDLVDRMGRAHVEFRTVPGSRDEVGRIEQVDYDICPDGAVKNLMTAVGIATDKIALLAGDPQKHELTFPDVDAAIAAGRERLARLRERGTQTA